MKIKDLTKKPSKTPKKSKSTTSKVKYHAPLVPLSLTIEISKNYKGVSDNIAGVIDSLPAPIKTLFSNAELKRVVMKHDKSMFVLNNGFTIRIEDIKFDRQNKKRVSIRHKKDTVFNGII